MDEIKELEKTNESGETNEQQVRMDNDPKPEEQYTQYQENAYNQPQGNYYTNPQENYNQNQGNYFNQPQGNYYNQPQGNYYNQPQGNYYNPNQGNYYNQPQGNYNNGGQPAKKFSAPDFVLWVVLGSFSTLCCMPVGIVVIVFSCLANNSFQVGNMEDYNSKMNVAKITFAIGAIASVLFWIAYICFCIFVTMAEY